jgi:four helix bundle protein
MAKPQPRDIKERTFSFALDVVRLCHTLDVEPGSGRALNRQLLRSGTSIGANVQEAQAGQSRADFVSKYAVALKEARETIYWLSLQHASAHSPDPRFDLLLHEANEIARILGAIIVNTKKVQRSK